MKGSLFLLSYILQVYQDGSISPETFDLLKQLNKAVHK